VDDSGKSLANDFEGQARQIFKQFGATLDKAGGKLGDMVQMTVFVTDVRYATASRRFAARFSATISPRVRSSRSPPWPIRTQRSRFKASP
jgi:enamine deaminase RidA (YjgF/YER057c/UK114 family)